MLIPYFANFWCLNKEVYTGANQVLYTTMLLNTTTAAGAASASFFELYFINDTLERARLQSYLLIYCPSVTSDPSHHSIQNY